ncbi:MAG: protein-glutamate O-methyltransferase [Pararhodobacter sp.]|nr:protein-glutamate O-methyltransferase [Pararhodobacter sp.]
MNAPVTTAMNGTPELSIGDREFAALAKLVHGESGIVLADAKKGLVVSRLARRLRDLGLRSFGEYCHLLQAEDGADERSKLISALTTNVTKFYREDHHFRSLEEQIFPALIARARGGDRIRIWSAGCSTGEEPYSIAMELLELCSDAAKLDIRILATDIDPQVLAVASTGQYTETASAGIPESRRARYTSLRNGRYEMSSALRELITFAPLNLVGQWPIRGPFDVIFCRNVVIYFDAATQERLWQRFAGLIPVGGHLFIGHSERLGRSAERFFTTTGITQYRRTHGSPDPTTGAS